MKYDFDMTVDEHSSVGKIVAQVAPETAVLEFGPGNGRMTNYLLQEKQCTVSIVEFDEELYNFVMQFATDGFLGNIEDYLWLEHFAGKTFDYIIFADVLEHLVDPEKALAMAKTLLKPTGRILITFPNLAHNSVLIGLFNNQLDWKEFGLLDHTHNTFYTQAGFEGVFERVGLTIAIEDFTYSQVGQNEIDTQYEQLPEKIQYAFRNRPFGEVYQYFYALSPEAVAEPIRHIPENSNFVKRVQLAFTVAGELSIQPLLFNQYTGENQTSVHQIATTTDSLKIVPFEGAGMMRFVAKVGESILTPSQTNAIWSNKDTYIFTGMNENPFFVFDHTQIAGKEVTLFFDLISENEFSADEKRVLEYSHRQTLEIEQLNQQRAAERLAVKEAERERMEQVQALLAEAELQAGLAQMSRRALRDYQVYDEAAMPELKLTVETIENDPERQVAIIKGWGFDKAEKTPLQYQLPLFEGLFYKVTPLYRKDVNEHFALAEKGKYGFIMEIEHKQIEKVVGLLVTTAAGKVYPLKFVRANLNNTPLVKRMRYILGAVRSQGIMTVLKNRRQQLLNADAYADWIRENEQFNVEKIKQELAQMAYQPKISLVVPVYNVEEKWLAACIASLTNQYYTNWELCLADDASTNPTIRPLIERYVQQDARIKAVFRPQNGHISEATNSAIDIATGAYIGFMDNDDELAPHALYEVVKALNEDRDYEFIYTDEDKMATNGKRFDPFFKPNWNEELLLGHNYITHFVVVKRSLLEQVGGLRSAFNGSQDYDFVLRATEAAAKVHHIPSICYHWRTVETSVAFDPTSKEYAYVAGKEAIAAALARRQLAGKVSMTKNYGAYKVAYTHLDEPLVSIIPVGQFERVSLWVADLLEHTYYSNFELVLPAKFQETFPTSDQRIRFVAGESMADLLAGAQGEYLVFTNEWLTPKKSSWLKELLNYLRKTSVGLVTGKILSEDLTVLNAGITIDSQRKQVIFDDFGTPEESIGYYFRSVLPREIYSITPDLFAIRKADFMTLLSTVLDENPVVMGAKLGQAVYTQLQQTVVFTPYSEMIWLNKQLDPFGQATWQDALATVVDPYKNPNSLG